MYVAVYRSGMPTGTTAERRAALIGWAYSPYRMNDMMSGVLDGWQTAQGRYLELHIFAGDTRTTDTMLYDSTGQAAVDRLSRFGQLRTIKFNGQTWTLQFDRLGTAPSVDYAPAWWTLAAGAVFSGLLFLLVLSLRTTRENASIIARQSTRDLLDRERELQESEQRWKFAVEGAGDGLWDWNIAAGTVYYSHLWKSMLGYADEEIGSSVDAWSLRVHPDDVAATIEALDDYLTGAAPEYEREHRVRCKDGTYKWVLDRGTVMERDAGGAPLRMIGTHKDIGDRKKMEAELTAGERTVAESEARFRSLVEQSIAGTYIIQHGAFTYTNLRFKAILGYGPEDDLVGVRVVDVVAPADRAEAAERMRALSAGEKDRTEASFEAIRKDGTTVHVGTTTAKAVYKHEEALIGVLQDVSDRKVAEARIARYANQLERTFIQTVALTTTLSEKRDPYTAGHEQRVAELATAIGEAMGLDHDRIEGLRVGGYLHDVGKISVPTELLVKPTRLTPIEESLMREHPRAGYEVLKEVDFPWPVAQVALQHHERLDGSGYPSGLKGDDIILEARIVAVADVVESMVSHRPYRPALGVGAALAEVQAGAGTKFDAEVVGVCIRLFREGGFWADATV
jgi:PAS domain S-box-containing protein/putative nucleotidyltransferase with HDIG domain